MDRLFAVCRWSRVLAGAAMLMLAAGAKADTFDYTITTSPPFSSTLTFSLSSSTAPSAFVAGQGLVYDNVDVTVNGGAPVASEVALGNPSGGAGIYNLAIGGSISFFGGGVESILTKLGDPNFAETGLQLYTGPESDPTLLAGTFHEGGGATVAVTDVPTATPEPGGVVLLGTGLLGALGMVRRRRA